MSQIVRIKIGGGMRYIFSWQGDLFGYYDKKWWVSKTKASTSTKALATTTSTITSTLVLVIVLGY